MSLKQPTAAYKNVLFALSVIYRKRGSIMLDTKITKGLEKIIEYAKSIDGKAADSFTAEGLIVSAIEAVSGKVDIAADSDETEKMRSVLIKYSASVHLDPDRLKAVLMCHINDGRETDFFNGTFYVQLCIQQAMLVVKERGQEELSADVLLEYIFNNPNDYLKKVLNQNNTQTDEFFRTVSAGISEMDYNESPKSAVEQLTDKIKRIQKELLDNVYGQEKAVSTFISGYFQAEMLSMTDKKRIRPRATFLFAGPPGVGKTLLAETAANVLQLPFKRFDMSGYSDKEATIEFCGSDAVYKDAKEGNVTSFVNENPNSVILFDEIEKAHINVIYLFLQILDAGRLRDSKTDKEVSFKDTIIIFTTNAGKQLYTDCESTDLSGLSRKVILKALQDDVNPTTKVPYFPAAICSRFSSGNVVMLNHITADNLYRIAEKESLRQVENLENAIDIKIKIDKSVYSALLFAEGGAADARTVRGRANSFLNEEIFELFRLMNSENVETGIKNLESVHFSVDLPSDKPEISELFNENEDSGILVFSSEKVFDECKAKSPDVKFISAQNIESAGKILSSTEISFVLIEATYGRDQNSKRLNIEDDDSLARDFFGFARECYSDVPVYLLQTTERTLSDEEKLSLLRLGAREIVPLNVENETFAERIKEYTEQIHRQKSMLNLARANKVVSFETAQTLSEDGKKAEISLFDFKLSTAVDAEDSQSILNSISKPDIGFDQVIGAEDAKKELRYFVDYLKNPKKYIGTGVHAPRGVLLYGPPGTGKTMLAKAMASESDVTFITAEGNQFLKRYMGEGPEKVHELFKTARKYAPSIIFVDEIDAIAKERKGDGEIEATLTAFLAEMDGFKNNTSKPVFVLAATNFDVEPGGAKSLDSALMRRFDRRLLVELPNRNERIQYINMKINANPVFELSDDKLNNIAVRSTGMSLAELESVLELSLRTAIRDGNMKVTDEIFDEAFETFNGGKAKEWDASLLERTARHEAGHALLYWMSGEKPSYVTIVARGSHGGYMQHDDNEGKALYTRDEMYSKIRTALGGRAAEIVYYGDEDGISTGASGDLETATRYARQMICNFGMNPKLGLAVIEQQALGNGDIAILVRNEINDILNNEMENAIKCIKDNMHLINLLVEKLLNDNHASGDEIAQIFENKVLDS